MHLAWRWSTTSGTIFRQMARVCLFPFGCMDTLGPCSPRTAWCFIVRSCWPEFMLYFTSLSNHSLKISLYLRNPFFGYGERSFLWSLWAPTNLDLDDLGWQCCTCNIHLWPVSALQAKGKSRNDGDVTKYCALAWCPEGLPIGSLGTLTIIRLVALVAKVAQFFHLWISVTCCFGRYPLLPTRYSTDPSIWQAALRHLKHLRAAMRDLCHKPNTFRPSASLLPAFWAFCQTCWVVTCHVLHRASFLSHCRPDCASTLSGRLCLCLRWWCAAISSVDSKT